MTDILSENQLQVLRALCDTVVPRIARPDDPDGFWARTGTDVGADQGALMVLSTMPPEQRLLVGGLLDVIGSQGFLGASQESREQILTTLSLASAAAGAGIRSVVSTP